MKEVVDRGDHCCNNFIIFVIFGRRLCFVLVLSIFAAFVMRFIYWSLASLGICATPPERLRDLFNSVKEFAKETGRESTKQDADTIIESAIRFAKNEGGQLDSFMDVLRTVCTNNISKCQLDQLAWDAVGQLYTAKSSEPSANKLNMVKSEKSETLSLTNKADIEQPAPAVSPMIDSFGKSTKKRSVSDESEQESSRSNRQRSEAREKVLSILGCLELLSKDGMPTLINKGIEFLNYLHYRMVALGDYDKLLDQLEMFGATHPSPMQVINLFDDALKRMRDPSYIVPKAFEDRMENERKDRDAFNRKPAELTRIMNKLQYICRDRGPAFRTPYGAVAEMADRLVQMAKNGDLHRVQYAISMYEFAGFSFGLKRALVQSTFDYLSRH